MLIHTFQSLPSISYLYLSTFSNRITYFPNVFYMELVEVALLGLNCGTYKLDLNKRFNGTIKTFSLGTSMAPFKTPACLLNLGHDQNLPPKTLSQNVELFSVPGGKARDWRRKKIILFFTLHLSIPLGWVLRQMLIHIPFLNSSQAWCSPCGSSY